MVNEIWKDIKDYEGMYQVSNLGNVRSLDKIDRQGNKIIGIHLTPSPNDKGYLRIFLSNGARYTKKAHRLVLETFVGPCPEGMEACHNNGIKTDNRLENLRWDTRKENAKDRVKHGTSTHNRGETHPLSKLTERQVKQIKILLKTKKIYGNKIAKMFNVSQGTINSIKQNKIWKHVA